MKYSHNHYLTVFFALISLIGCTKFEKVEARKAKPERILSPIKDGPITHLYSDTVYINETASSTQQFTINSGEQLIIDPGTVIKGVYFVIKPGGTILANGTKENPIVFTSRSLTGNQGVDNLAAFRIEGKSRNNSVNTPYDSLDFSGTLRYVRIEFAPLILQSVGSRTIIENVMVSYSGQSSSFEIRGGSFNARNLVSYACGGPVDYYITQGYTGKMQNVLAYRHPFFGVRRTQPPNTVSGVFIENNSSATLARTARPYTFPYISNLTVLGPDRQNGSTAAYSDTSTSFRSAALVTTAYARFQIRNSIFAGFPGAAWYIDDSTTASDVSFRRYAVRNSIFHSNFRNRVFYIRNTTLLPFTSADFMSFMMNPGFEFNTRIFERSGDFMFGDPFNYDKPDLLPVEGSPVLSGADFTGSDFGDPFFTKVQYVGSIGRENWLESWTNFTPLKTNYNFQK